MSCTFEVLLKQTIMANKIKSLIYLSCFMLSAILYTQSDVTEQSSVLPTGTEVVEAHIQRHLDTAPQNDIFSN